MGIYGLTYSLFSPRGGWGEGKGKSKGGWKRWNYNVQIERVDG